MEKVFIRFPVILVTGLVSFVAGIYQIQTRDKLRTLELLSARIHNIVQHLDCLLPRLARMVEHVLEKRF